MLLIGSAHAQSQPETPARTEAAEINLRKSIVVREYEGRQVSGEERPIGRGDSLWRILIEEKGLPEKRFRSYLVVIRGVNPQVKNLDVLRAGDKIFIPLNLDDGEEPPPRREASATDASQRGSASTVNYQVKAGEHLFRILRERYKNADDRKIAQYFALVKDLNPERQNWETLHGGEVIRLPALDAGSDAVKREGSARASSPAPASMAEVPPVAPAKTAISRRVDSAEAMRAPARDNLPLFMMVAEATGNEVQLIGEESVTLPDGTIRFDKGKYPVIYNAALRQRVVIDPEGKIPPSLKARLNDPRIGTPVVPMANGLSIADAVRELLVSIGYQPLPAERPVVIHEAGITFEAKGNWMALAPAVSNKPQEVIVVNLTGRANEIPAYLTAELEKRGVHLRDVVLPQAIPAVAPLDSQRQLRNPGPAKELPKDKRELVDALLLSFQVPFGVAENISVELRDGLSMETRVDRVFELDGMRTAVFFRRIDPVMRQALQEKYGTKTFEIDIDSLSPREIIFRVLSLLGDPAAYSEHRFSAAEGLAPDRLTLKAWGFNVKKKPMFVTDRQIAPALQRFFFEKGLEIVYFH